jgi:hypothetical protein
LGERLLCKQEVVGSIPITSTTAPLMRSISGRKARQRLRSNRESAGAGLATSIGKMSLPPVRAVGVCDL